MRRTEQDMIQEIAQYTGKVFPGTTMLIKKFAGRNDRNQIIVECNSPSRGDFTAVWNEIKRGNTKGTIRGEACIRRNNYKIEQDIVKVFFNLGGYFVCDKQDLDLVKNHLAINAPVDYVVDHINKNKLDNRRCNLRICKPIDNSHNMSIFSTNSSGHTGVSKTKSGKYDATIVANYKVIHLGVFDNYNAACEAYDEAKQKYHKVGVVCDDGFAGLTG